MAPVPCKKQTKYKSPISVTRELRTITLTTYSSLLASRRQFKGILVCATNLFLVMGTDTAGDSQCMTNHWSPNPNYKSFTRISVNKWSNLLPVSKFCYDLYLPLFSLPAGGKDNKYFYNVHTLYTIYCQLA